MAKVRGVEAKLGRLRALRGENATPNLIAELRSALADTSNLVSAEAAEIIGAMKVADVGPDLVAAFERFMIRPEESDKLCKAKTAIVEALNKIEYEHEAVFLRGIHHVQMEPVWGGSQDTAAQLRGNSAFGLVRLNHRGVLILLVDLLADPEKVARQSAAQALGQIHAAVPLLRLKARVGDDDAEVTAECLSALVGLEPKESLPFVAEFLRDDSVQEGAALALGDSRRPEALEILKDFWPQVQSGPMQEATLLAIAMLRLPAALDFLLEVLAGQDAFTTMAALSALAIHRHNESLRDRIAAIVAQKGDPNAQARFDKKFTP